MSAKAFRKTMNKKKSTVVVTPAPTKSDDDWTLVTPEDFAVVVKKTNGGAAVALIIRRTRDSDGNLIPLRKDLRAKPATITGPPMLLTGYSKLAGEGTAGDTIKDTIVTRAKAKYNAGLTEGFNGDTPFRSTLLQEQAGFLDFVGSIGKKLMGDAFESGASDFQEGVAIAKEDAANYFSVKLSLTKDQVQEKIEEDKAFEKVFNAYAKSTFIDKASGVIRTADDGKRTIHATKSVWNSTIPYQSNTPLPKTDPAVASLPSTLGNWVAITSAMGVQTLQYQYQMIEFGRPMPGSSGFVAIPRPTVKVSGMVSENNNPPALVTKVVPDPFFEPTKRSGNQEFDTLVKIRMIFQPKVGRKIWGLYSYISGGRVNIVGRSKKQQIAMHEEGLENTEYYEPDAEEVAIEEDAEESHKRDREEDLTESSNHDDAESQAEKKQKEEEADIEAEDKHLQESE